MSKSGNSFILLNNKNPNPFSINNDETSESKMILKIVPVGSKNRPSSKCFDTIFKNPLQKCFSCIKKCKKPHETSIQLTPDIEKQIAQYKESFDPEKEEHRNKLEELFKKSKEKLLLREKDTLIEDDNLDEIKKNFGFNSKHPENEIRAGGMFSVDFMQYFIENNPTLRESKMFFEDLSFQNFKFAPVCCRLSFLMRISLGLSDDVNLNLQLKANNIVKCTNDLFNNFIRHVKKDNKYLFKMLLVELNKIIKELKNKGDFSYKDIEDCIKHNVEESIKEINNDDISAKNFDSENKNKIHEAIFLINNKF